MLDDRYSRYLTFLKKKNHSWKLIHTRTRKAFRSKNNNLNNLYIFKEYEWKNRDSKLLVVLGISIFKIKTTNKNT